MTLRTGTAVFLLPLFLMACQPKTATTNVLEADAPATPAVSVQPLEASFMSAGQSFSYTVHYDGALMQIVDGQFDGASVVEPSFSVNGGSQIVLRSASTTDITDLKTRAGEPQNVNGLVAYHLSETQDACAVDTTLVPVSVESLVMTLKICDGQDAQLGQQAMFSLLEKLEVKAL